MLLRAQECAFFHVPGITQYIEFDIDTFPHLVYYQIRKSKLTRAGSLDHRQTETRADQRDKLTEQEPDRYTRTQYAHRLDHKTVFSMGVFYFPKITERRCRAVEKVIDFVPNPETFENDIELHLQLFCEQNGIEDVKKESQSIWNAALMYIHKNVFRDRETFRNRKLIRDSNNIMDSTYNIYDMDMVNEVCNIYIYLCMRYEKEISILGFSELTGIPDSTVYQWGYTERKLSQKGMEISQKLTKFNEESLSNKLASGKSNPVGIIAMLNRKHGWASPYTADAARQQREVLTAEQLPQLGQKAIKSLPDTDTKNENEIKN